MKENKLVLPVSILLGCIILGSFYYASEVNRQKQTDIKVGDITTTKNNPFQKLIPKEYPIYTAQQEEKICTDTYGTNAYLRNASTGYCGCKIGYSAMYIQGQGEQCVDPSNVLLIPKQFQSSN